jgi:hypothetical protein
MKAGIENAEDGKIISRFGVKHGGGEKWLEMMN